MRRFLTFCIAVAFALNLIVPARGEDFANSRKVTWREVQERIETFKSVLLNLQEANGSIVYPRLEVYSLGMTALAALALIESGMPASDPAIQRMITYILRTYEDAKSVYSISLCSMLLAKVDPKKYATYLGIF
ncbi:MAG: hypothetical protein WC712_14120, partial [Candidatus Brocadiia bacterium]